MKNTEISTIKCEWTAVMDVSSTDEVAHGGGMDYRKLKRVNQKHD
jgi:hypothetical protein